jgi:hypothetical protein
MCLPVWCGNQSTQEIYLPKPETELLEKLRRLGARASLSGLNMGSRGLDRVIVPNQRHLRQTLSEYAAHYHSRRPHQDLKQDNPFGLVPVWRRRSVRYHKVLGSITRTPSMRLRGAHFPRGLVFGQSESSGSRIGPRFPNRLTAQSPALASQPRWRVPQGPPRGRIRPDIDISLSPFLISLTHG